MLIKVSLHDEQEIEADSVITACLCMSFVDVLSKTSNILRNSEFAKTDTLANA